MALGSSSRRQIVNNRVGNPGIVNLAVVSDGRVGNDSNTYVQNTPCFVWPINHSLNSFPEVTIIDSTGNKVGAEVKYSDANNITLNFDEAFTGTVVLD